jgi:hypothetical protein
MKDRLHALLVHGMGSDPSWWNPFLPRLVEIGIDAQALLPPFVEGFSPQPPKTRLSVTAVKRVARYLRASSELACWIVKIGQASFSHWLRSIDCSPPNSDTTGK